MALRWLACATLTGIVVAACGGPSGAPSPSAVVQASASAPPAATPTPVTGTPAPTTAAVTFDQAVKVADDGRSLHVTCWGSGGPAIVLDGGHPGPQISGWARSPTFISSLAAERRVCAYDRAGWGDSDPAPKEPRDLEDVTDDLRALLQAAGIETPVVLVGASFGGAIVAYYAHRFPGDVLAVVMVDVPAPSSQLTLEDAPELAWDATENPEHVDVVPEFENRLARERFPFTAPLLVLTATGGQSNVADQAFWLDWSETSSQVELPGSHNLAADSAQEVAAAILALPDLGD